MKQREQKLWKYFHAGMNWAKIEVQSEKKSFALLKMIMGTVLFRCPRTQKMFVRKNQQIKWYKRIERREKPQENCSFHGIGTKWKRETDKINEICKYYYFFCVPLGFHVHRNVSIFRARHYTSLRRFVLSGTSVKSENKGRKKVPHKRYRMRDSIVMLGIMAGRLIILA